MKHRNWHTGNCRRRSGMFHTDRKGVVAVDITRNGAPDGPLTRSRSTTAPAVSLRLSFGAEPRAVLDARGVLGPLVPPAHGPLPGERTTAPNVGAAAYVSTLGCDLNELENRHLVEGRPSNGAKLVPAAAGGVKLDVERERPQRGIDVVRPPAPGSPRLVSGVRLPRSIEALRRPSVNDSRLVTISFGQHHLG